MPVGELLCIVHLVEKGKRKEERGKRKKGGLIEGVSLLYYYIVCLLLCIKYV